MFHLLRALTPSQRSAVLASYQGRWGMEFGPLNVS